MNKYIKPKIDEKKLGNNPLIASDFVVVINKVTNGSMKPDKETEIMLPVEYEMEKENITKLYTKPENRLIISALSPGAKSLFIWLAYEVDCGKDYLWVNYRRYMEENYISSVNTYKSAIAELCRYSMMYPTL